MLAAPGDRRLLEELTETIIPADSHSPGAKAARVPEYIEQVLSASVDEQQRQLWKTALPPLTPRLFWQPDPAAESLWWKSWRRRIRAFFRI